MTDPKDTTIRELAKQIAELADKLATAEFAEEARYAAEEQVKTLLAENEKLRRIVPEFERRMEAFVAESIGETQKANGRMAISWINQVKEEMLGTELPRPE